MIQLHRLEGFFHVARHGGYTRAARAFPYPISQPGVYQQVRKLEQDLGLPLFERVGRDRVALTAQGRHLHAFCAPFFEALPELTRALRAGRIGGQLRVEASPLEMREIVPRFVGRLRRRRPDIEVVLTEVQESDPERLLRNEVDLIVDYVPSAPAGITAHPLAIHHGYLIVPAAHPAARRRRVHVASLRRTPFLGYTAGSREAALQAEGLVRFGLAPEASVRASSTDALLALVGAGLGYSVIPWPGGRGPRRAGVAAIRVSGHDFPVSILYRERELPDPLVQAALAATSSTPSSAAPARSSRSR
jgi:DNA-binding transcriptional LysR family regulator